MGIPYGHADYYMSIILLHYNKAKLFQDANFFSSHLHGLFAGSIHSSKLDLKFEALKQKVEYQIKLN
jgi:hypothetical protein